MENNSIILRDVTINIDVLEELVKKVFRTQKKIKLVSKKNFIKNTPSEIQILLDVKVSDNEGSLEQDVDSIERELYEKLFYFCSYKKNRIFIRIKGD